MYHFRCHSSVLKILVKLSTIHQPSYLTIQLPKLCFVISSPNHEKGHYSFNLLPRWQLAITTMSPLSPMPYLAMLSSTIFATNVILPPMSFATNVILPPMSFYMFYHQCYFATNVICHQCYLATNVILPPMLFCTNVILPPVSFCHQCYFATDVILSYHANHSLSPWSLSTSVLPQRSYCSTWLLPVLLPQIALYMAFNFLPVLLSRSLCKTREVKWVGSLLHHVYLKHTNACGFLQIPVTIIEL